MASLGRMLASMKNTSNHTAPRTFPMPNAKAFSRERNRREHRHQQADDEAVPQGPAEVHCIPERHYVVHGGVLRQRQWAVCARSVGVFTALMAMIAKGANITTRSRKKPQENAVGLDTSKTRERMDLRRPRPASAWGGPLFGDGDVGGHARTPSKVHASPGSLMKTTATTRTTMVTTVAHCGPQSDQVLLEEVQVV